MPASVASAPYRHAPASRASAAPAPSLRERLDRIEWGIAVMKAGNATLRGLDGLVAADEALAKGDAAGAGRRHLADAPAYEAYHARLRGERYRAPVAVAKAETDHRDRIRKLVSAGDMAGLGGLMRADPAADRQYREMTRAGELTEAAAEGKAKLAVAAVGSRGPATIAKRMTPADVTEAEIQATMRWLRTLLARKDHKGLEAARRTVAGRAVWAALVTNVKVEAA